MKKTVQILTLNDSLCLYLLPYLFFDQTVSDLNHHFHNLTQFCVGKVLVWLLNSNDTQSDVHYSKPLELYKNIVCELLLCQIRFGRNGIAT